ncbi:MAG: hypothetical protein ACKVGW_20440 [Verrucomicrobiia bacterium]
MSIRRCRRDFLFAYALLWLATFLPGLAGEEINGIQARIIGGDDVDDGDYPWMGALIRSGYEDLDASPRILDGREQFGVHVFPFEGVGKERMEVSNYLGFWQNFDLETFIVHSDDLREGDFRIFNFDHGVLGSYRFRITQWSEPESVPVGVDVQRAITKKDNMNEPSSGPVEYFEIIQINNTDSYSNITIEVNGNGDFIPLIAVFDEDASDLVDQNIDDPATLELNPVKGTRYSLLVLSESELLDRNYQLKITGVERLELVIPGLGEEPVEVISISVRGEGLNQVGLEWLDQLGSNEDQ